MRQRLAVARAFLHAPKVLLLDEPFTALDDRAIAVLQRLLHEALAEGKTIVMSTHQLREALELATHVAMFNRSFARELSNDCLDALISAPIPGAALFLGKALANYILVLAVELIALPLFGVFYNVRWTAQFWQLMMVIALATWGMTVTGTMFSALTVNIRLREVMLPILNFPILIPALLGAMQLTSALVAGKLITAANEAWLKMLIGFDVMYTAVSVFLVETV